MAAPRALHTENANGFEDLSGITSTSSDNPYVALIEACKDSPVRAFNIWIDRH